VRRKEELEGCDGKENDDESDQPNHISCRMIFQREEMSQYRKEGKDRIPVKEGKSKRMLSCSSVSLPRQLPMPKNRTEHPTLLLFHLLHHGNHRYFLSNYTRIIL
jgi:hypothetical protein